MIKPCYLRFAKLHCNLRGSLQLRNSAQRWCPFLLRLQTFMDTFNDIARSAHSSDDTFYSQRGIKIHSLEVTRYQCADQSTSAILEAIIQETTNVSIAPCVASEHQQRSLVLTRPFHASYMCAAHEPPVLPRI